MNKKQKFWDTQDYSKIVVMIERAQRETKIQGPSGSTIIVQPGDYLCRDLHGFVWKESILSPHVYPVISQCDRNLFVAETSFRVLVAKKTFLVKKSGVSIFRGEKGDSIIIFSSKAAVVIRRGLNQENLLAEVPSFFPLHVDATIISHITFHI